MKLRRGAEQFDKVSPVLEKNSSVKGIKRLLDVLMIQWFKVTKEVIGFYGQSCLRSNNPGGALWAASIIVASELEFIVLQRNSLLFPPNPTMEYQNLDLFRTLLFCFVAPKSYQLRRSLISFERYHLPITGSIFFQISAS
jgi:hypothetical protein